VYHNVPGGNWNEFPVDDCGDFGFNLQKRVVLHYFYLYQNLTCIDPIRYISIQGEIIIMAKLRELGSKMWEAYGIDPRTILIKPGFNPRDTSTPEAKKHIAWLKSSIKERGVDEPIFIENTGGKNGKLYLIDGECRLLACQQLWNEGVKVRVPTISYEGDEIAILKKSVVANNGLPLTQLELGKASDRLVALGMTIAEVANLVAPHLGFVPKKAQRHVKDAIELNRAPLKVKEAVAKGVGGVKVSAASAIQEVRKDREGAADRLEQAAERARSEGKTEVKRTKTAGPATVRKQTQMSALEAAERLAQAVEVWVEDATLVAEKKLVETVKLYREIVPKREALAS